MLTEEQLEIISEAIQPLFQYLEHEVIVDIARRIAKTMTYTRTAELQAMSMKKLGYSPAKIRSECMKLLNADADYRKEVARNTMEYKREVRKIINAITKEAYRANDEIVANAGNMSWVHDLSVWKDTGETLGYNSFLEQLVGTFIMQTAGELKNMTRTTGFKTMHGYAAVENAYQRELDKAVIKICSGTFSQDRVLREVVHELAQSGLRSVDFASGYSMQLDTAARLAIRTGCHQLAGKVQDENIKQTGKNLVYVSKHRGARNKGEGIENHEKWQGKVYYIKQGQDYTEEAKRIGQDSIEDLWKVTGYSADGAHESDPRGLYGHNCRHNHYIWFEGTSGFPAEAPEPEPVIIGGKSYDYYAMTQKMRVMERGIRALKREREALKALGIDAAEANAKIRNKTKEYQEFCKACGVPEKSSKLRYECGTSDLKKTKAWKEYDEQRTELIKDYRITNSNGKIISAKNKVDLQDSLSVLSQKAKKTLKNVTFQLNSDIGSGYDHGSKTIYISKNATKREILHEVGHHLEFSLVDQKETEKLKKELVNGLTKNDIIIKRATDSLGNSQNIFLINSSNFINEYQSRLYVDELEEAVNTDGTINIDVLGEVISTATEYYYTFPNTMKKYFKEMFDFMERVLNG